MTVLLVAALTAVFALPAGWCIGHRTGRTRRHTATRAEAIARPDNGRPLAPRELAALDQLGEGLPVLSVPGRSMRSRQTAVLLEKLDVPELVARDLADYRARALALIADPSACEALRDRIVANRERLYNTAPVHRAFADFLASAS